jgi:hypothetical protein
VVAPKLCTSLSDAICFQWELGYEDNPLPDTLFPGRFQHWPPSDLAEALIGLYFMHCNSMFPLLHRPTFARHFAGGLYESDIWFACTCMCVFALASRYTNDARVLLDEPVEVTLEHAEPFQWQTAGFKYYFSILGKFMDIICTICHKTEHITEVENKKRSMLSPASLFEIQTLCVCPHVFVF